MLVALLSQNLQIFLRKRQRLSLGHSWTPSRQEVTSYREGVYRTLSNCPGKVSFRAVRSINARLPQVEKCRMVARALVARAMLHVGEGRNEEAWRDLLACHRLGRLVGRGGTPIEGLVYLTIDHMASTADLAYLDCARLTAKQAQGCLQDLQGLQALPHMADKIDSGERFLLLDTILMIDRLGLDYLAQNSDGRAARN